MSSAREALEQVGFSGEPPSIPETLFREFVAGRISKEDYETQTAVWVAENLRQYCPRMYPEVGPVVLEYVRARVNHVRESRDPSLHQKLSNWTFWVRKLLEQNDADRDLLAWCLPKLEAKGLRSQAEDVRSKLSEFCLLIPEHLEAAMICQAMDMREKSREVRG
jgi:hypothetical protein